MDYKRNCKVVQTKGKLYENFLKRRTPENKEIYKDHKNLFEMIKSKSKQNFYSVKLIEFQVDAKKHRLSRKN